MHPVVKRLVKHGEDSTCGRHHDYQVSCACLQCSTPSELTTAVCGHGKLRHYRYAPVEGGQECLQKSPPVSILLVDHGDLAVTKIDRERGERYRLKAYAQPSGSAGVNH